MTFRSWRAKSVPALIGLGAIVLAACGSTSPEHFRPDCHQDHGDVR